MLRRIDQFHPSLTFGDAVSNDCFELQRLLWVWGLRSDLYAEFATPEVRRFVREERDLPAARRDDGLLLAHLSMGSDSLDRVAQSPLRIALRYHNITPARYFAGLNEHAHRYAERGREQLARFAKVAELGLGDSEFNRRELASAGFARTAVVPILVDWAQHEVEPDAAVLRRLADERTAILAVGQILPQKAVHDLIAAFARYREADATARLYLVGSTVMSGSYRARLDQQVARAGLQDAVAFAGRVTTEELVAYYRGATAFLTLSDHEGFCVPLLEAMRFHLPIVAHDAGAIAETLGDAGILLRDKSADAVAAALERAVRDAGLRGDLVARGERRLAEFSTERVGQRLREALASAALYVPAARPRRLAVLSSAEDDGIRPYAQALVAGLESAGHAVRYLGVRRASTADLDARVAAVPRDTDALVVEHEFALFRDVPFVLALLRLRLRGVPVILSLHELEPDKFHHYRLITRALHYRQSYASLLEVLRVPWVALVLGWRLLRYRAVTLLLGALPKRIVIHSERSRFWIDLLTRDRSKVEELPLLIRPLGAVRMPRDAEERRALRERLGLPVDRFTFVSPGFFFRRKRFLELLSVAPRDALILLSGTRDPFDPTYFDEVQAFIAERKLDNVVVRTDFAAMNEHVAAADCVVLYYEQIFQSGLATQALWAGLPCIFSDLKGFHLYEGAGLFARHADELREAMAAVRDQETYARLRRQALVLRRLLAPDRIAPQYLVDLER